MIVSIWLSAVFFQIGVITILAAKFRKYVNGTDTGKHSISVVVAAHNEHDNLQKLVPALLKQEHQNFEIIISLDRCTDQSLEYLDTKNDPKLKIVNIAESAQGWDHKKFALTKGIEKAAGEWIVFTDADCVPTTSKWLNEMNSHFGEPVELVLGYSPYSSNGSLLQSFIRYESFLTGFQYLAMAIAGKPYMGVGRNMAVNRELFVKSGGYEDFKETVGGDDDLFIQKNAHAENTRVCLGEQCSVLTHPSKSWRAYWKQKTRHLKVASRYSLGDKVFHVLSGGSHLLVWVLFPLIANHIILSILLFYLLIKWISYRFATIKMGSGFNYIYLPLVDVMYAILLPIVALGSRLTKDTRWKN